MISIKIKNNKTRGELKQLALYYFITLAKGHTK